jgi:hypothetical protein
MSSLSAIIAGPFLIKFYNAGTAHSLHPFYTVYKVKVKLSLGLTKHYVMEACGGVDV